MRLRAISILAVLAVAGMAPVALAQEASFSLDLNGAEPKDSACSFTFLAKNKLGVDLADMKIQIYGLSATNVAQGAWFLSFSNINNKKIQMKTFDLPKSCDKIAKFIVNGFIECKGDKDYLDVCNKGLKTSSSLPIGFSNDAE